MSKTDENKGVLWVLLVGLLPAILCLVALLDMPYGYYTFLRIVIMLFAGCFAVLAVVALESPWMLIAFAITGILFNPAFKIGFSRDVWAFIDVAVALLFAIFTGSAIKRWKR